MKNYFSILLVLLSVAVKAQVPQALNYQAVARTAQGAIVAGQTVNVRFSVLEGSVTGTAVYQELHTANTNNFGLFTLAIGKGTAVLGSFSTVNWGGADKFLKVEISLQGGGAYQLQGTTQLLSVPFALYAERTRLIGGNAITISNGNTVSAAYTAGTGIAINGSTIAGNYAAGTGVNINGATISGAYQAGVGINVNGATISGAYQPGVGININGATISGAYQGGNAININGNTIAAAYQAGPGVAINGNVISGNYSAGTGININGGVISATSSGSANHWVQDINGIHSLPLRVGIGVDANSIYPLLVRQQNTGVGHGVAVFESEDVWHAAIGLKNNTTNQQFAFLVGGINNRETLPRNFGLFNNNLLRNALVVDGNTNRIGFGLPTVVTPNIRSTIHVFTGDVNIEEIGSGIIMRSPNGNCWRITIDNAGNLIRTAIVCP